MPPTLSQATSAVHTALPAQYLRPSSLLCFRPDGLKLSTGQSPRPGSRQLQATTYDGLLQPLLSTLSAVEMLHDSVLYKYMIDIEKSQPLSIHCFDAVCVQLILDSVPSYQRNRTNGPQWSVLLTGWHRKSSQGEIDFSFMQRWKVVSFRVKLFQA